MGVLDREDPIPQAGRILSEGYGGWSVGRERVMLVSSPLDTYNGQSPTGPCKACEVLFCGFSEGSRLFPSGHVFEGIGSMVGVVDDRDPVPADEDPSA